MVIFTGTADQSGHHNYRKMGKLWPFCVTLATHQNKDIMCFKLTYENENWYKVLIHCLNIAATPFECFDISKIFGVVHSMAILLLLKNNKNGQLANFCIGIEFDGYRDNWYHIILSIMCDSLQIHKN